MSILWCGSEPSDMVIWPSPLTYEAAHMRSGYARGGLKMADNSSAWGYGAAFSGLTNFWLSIRFYRDIATAVVLPRFGLVAGTSDQKGIWIGYNSGAAANELCIYKYDGATFTQLGVTSTSGLLTNALHKIDIHLNGLGAGATLDAWIDGTQGITGATVDASISGVSNLTRFAGRAITTSSGGTSCTGSEFIVADEDTRAMSVVTLAPNGAGDNPGTWQGTFQAVDEGPQSDDSDVVIATANGQQFMCALSDLPDTNVQVKAIRIVARAEKGASGLSGLKLGVKSGSTVDVDSAHTQDVVFTPNDRYMITNPATGTSFSPSELNSLQLVLEVAT